MRSKSDDPTRRQVFIEKELNKIRLQDFNFENSQAYDMLIKKFGSLPSREALLSLARVLSYHLKINLDREAYRRKNVLLKWYDEKYLEIKDVLMNGIDVETEFETNDGKLDDDDEIHKDEL